MTMEKLKAGAVALGLKLEADHLGLFDTYYQEIVTWNRRMNLTAITDYDEAQIKHFLDALTITLAWPVPKFGPGLRVIDVGTGAGIPGIALKIVFPDIRLTLLDSVAKKTVFLHHVAEKLELHNIEIITGRAEQVAHQAQHRERFYVVLSRAVAPLPTLVELTLPFCAIGGSLIAQEKGDIEREIDKASRAIDLLGGKIREVKHIDLPEFRDGRGLVIVDKIAPTPRQYPRRPGIPAKRPLDCNLDHLVVHF